MNTFLGLVCVGLAVLAFLALIGVVIVGLKNAVGRGDGEQRKRRKAPVGGEVRSVVRVPPSKEYALTIEYSPERRMTTITVPSQSDPAVTYTLDLGELTCSCEDFRPRRGQPRDRLSRLCKHLMRELLAHDEIVPTDEWQRAIIDSGYGAPSRAWLVDLASAPAVLAVESANPEWVNIYARTKRKGETISAASGPLQEHGWNIPEHRWSYGKGPPGAGELREWMINKFRGGDRKR